MDGAEIVNARGRLLRRGLERVAAMSALGGSMFSFGIGFGMGGKGLSAPCSCPPPMRLPHSAEINRASDANAASSFVCATEVGGCKACIDDESHRHSSNFASTSSTSMSDICPFPSNFNSSCTAPAEAGLAVDVPLHRWQLKESDLQATNSKCRGSRRFGSAVRQRATSLGHPPLPRSSRSMGICSRAWTAAWD